MSAAGSVLCVLLGSALTVCALWLVVRHGVRQVTTATAYRELSGRLGLQADTRGVSAHGYVGQRQLWIGSVMEGFGPERRMVMRGVLTLERPLGLGLLVHRRGLPSRVLRRFGPERGSGDKELDKIAHVHGADRARLVALLDADVRAALHHALRAWSGVEVTDGDIRVQLRRPESSAQRLFELVEAMLTLAVALERARAKVEAPEGVAAWCVAWEPVCARLGLTWDPSLPAMHGELEGRRVLVTATRESEGYAAEATLWFGEHEDIGLRVRPQVEPDGYWSVGQDIEVGEPEFDQSFVIKGYDPDEVRDVLSPRARAALRRLLGSGKVVVDDRTVTVRELDGDPDGLVAVLRELTALADAIGW